MSGDSALPSSMKIATVWLLAGTVLFVAVQWWLARADRARFSFDGAAVELQRGPDGHFHWPGRVNGVAVDFLVDTGATRTALPRSLAREAGVTIVGATRSGTAGGEVRGEAGVAEVVLAGGVQVQRLPVTVLPRLDTPLLGMDILGRLRLTQSAGVLRIEASGPPEGFRR